MTPKIDPAEKPNQRKAKEFQTEQRRQVIAANLKAGLSYRQMAEALGVSLGTISKDAKIILSRLHREQIQAAADTIVLELARLDAALNAIWDDVLAGETRAVEALLKIMERRAKLLGIDQPSLLKLVDWRAELPEGFDADEVERQFAAMMLAGQKQGGAGASPTGDDH